VRYLIVLLSLILLAGCASKPILKASQTQSTAIVAPTASSVAPAVQSAPIASESLSAANLQPPATLDPNEIDCMATAIYEEARGETEKGKIGVGYVVMNRVKSKRWPPTVCEVVYQCSTRASPHSRRRSRICQFGWAAQRVRIVDARSYAHAQDLARLIMLGFAPNPIGRCTYFHSTAERTPRGRKYAMKIRVDHHLFYEYQLADL
jgi:spore germination cell wall hydrolase CwlJ-like protein